MKDRTKILNANLYAAFLEGKITEDENRMALTKKI